MSFTRPSWYAAVRTLTLTVADFGIGIACRVRRHLRRPLSDKDALTWALQEGNTTSTTGPRGLGLKLLRNFVEVNGGTMTIYTNTVYAEMSSRGIRFDSITPAFSGAVLHIELKCDARSYVLASEAPAPCHHVLSSR